MTHPVSFRPPPLPPPARGDDVRLGHLLQRQVGDDTEAVLLGFPCDQGVKRNRGRAGASLGPAALRDALYRLTPDARLPAHRHLLERTADLGELELTGELEEDQERLARAVSVHLEAGRLPIVLGGGHETAYGHFLAHTYAARGRRGITILNWDAHPDVRPLEDDRGHSGSPFRQALQHASRTCAGYAVAGLLPHSVAAPHLRFLEEHGCRLWWRDALSAPGDVDEVYRTLDGPLLVSFDLDAVDEAAAPGVSAPAAGGLPSALWLRAAEGAGEDPRLVSADVVELNPLFDRDGRTARLAALTVWHLLRGRALRATSPSGS